MAPRVAIASRWIEDLSGATTLILEQTRGFSKLGWEVHLYGERLDENRIRQAGGIPRRLPAWPWGSYFKRRLFAWFFERAIRKEKFDLIVGNGDTLRQDVLFLHNCVHAAHEAVRGTTLPESSGVGRMHARILSERRFRLLIANSELMKRDVIRRFGVPADMVAVIHPGCDPKRFRPEDREALGSSVRKELGVKPGDVLIGLTTSGDFKKRGVSILLGALGRLPPDIREKTHALIAGKENHLESYRQLARQTGLGDRIHFMPPIPRVEEYYHALDIFAYPALFEEFGLSVEEALACGVPVLTSARVGAAELLRGPEREFVIEKPEETIFSFKLADLIRRSELRRHMSQAGIAACQGNSWEEYFKRSLARIETLLPISGHSRKGAPENIARGQLSSDDVAEGGNPG